MEVRDQHNPKSQPSQNTIYERLWLTYFNDTLYAKGVITEKERNKMRTAIKCHIAGTPSLR